MILHANATHALYASAAFGADVMIVDPPYSSRVHSKAVSAGTGGRGVRKRDLGFGHLSEALLRRIARYASQVRRWSIVFCDVESIGVWRDAMLTASLVEYIRPVPWVRWSQPQLSGDRPPSGCEMVLAFHRTLDDGKPARKRWSGPGGRISYQAKSLRGRDKYSCEKPLDLMLSIVSDFSDPGECVFDPCAGVGTTAVAARLLGRTALGLEARADVADAANERLAALLSARDAKRAARFADETREEASAIPFPKCPKKSDVKTYERAQRRLADASKVKEECTK